MRKFQKVSVCIMAVALATTDCSSGSTGAKTPAEPARAEATGEAKAQAADGEAAGEKDPVLMVYTACSEALNNAAIPEFEKDTGARIEVVVAGTDELLERVQSEKDNPLDDIFWVADQTILSTSKDLFMEYISSKDGNMLETFHNIAGYFTLTFVGPAVIIVSKDLKGGVKIDGFKDLLDPELKDKIAFGDPVNSSSAFQSLLAVLYGTRRDGDPLSSQAWDYAGQFIANLDDKICSNSSQVYKGVAEGRYVIGLTQKDSAADYVKEGAAVEIVFPEEGVIFLRESVQILRDCKHPENAKKFVDYMLSEKIQNTVGSNLTVRLLRKGAKLADYMTPRFEIKLFDNCDEGWVAEHKTEVTNLLSKHMETSMG